MDAETTTTEEKKTKAPAVPRGPSPENQKRLDHILIRTAAEPGVTSPTLAKELGISTLQCSQLTDRLVKQGKLVIRKIGGGVRTNYLPDQAPALSAASSPADVEGGDAENDLT